MSTSRAPKNSPQISVCAANLSGSPAVTLSGIAMSSAGLCQSRPGRGEAFQKLASECLSAWIKGAASLTSQRGAATSGCRTIKKWERWGQPAGSRAGRNPSNSKFCGSENTGLLEKVESTAWRKVLKCSEHSLKFTSGIKLPNQIGSQSPKHAGLSLSLFLPVTN